MARRDTGRWMLLATLTAYVLLALAYNATIREMHAPDEPWHYLYVRSLAEGRGLPTVQETHQAQHPPLYYVAAALFSRLTSPLRSADIPVAAAAEGRRYAYFRREAHFLRFLSTLLGCGLVCTVYRIARRLAPADPWVVTLAPAFAAFMPLFTYQSAAINNDVAVALLVTLVLLQTAAYLQEGGGRRLLVTGVLLALAALTKASALFAVAMPLAAVLWRSRASKEDSRVVSHLALLLGPFLLGWGWWPIRCRLVEGVFFPASMAQPWQQSVSPAFLQNPLVLPQLLVLAALPALRSFLAPEWILMRFVDTVPYVAVVIVLFLVVCVGLLRRRKLRGGELWSRAFLNICLLGVCLLGAGIFHYMVWVDCTAVVGGRYMVPMVGAMALFAALGTRALLPLRPGRAPAIAAGAAWVVLAAAGTGCIHLTRTFYRLY